MQKQKLIPICIAIILVIVGIIIFVNLQSKNATFEKLIVTYKGQKQEYDNIKIDGIIVVNKDSFEVISINKSTLVLRTSSVIYENDEKVNEVTININELKTVCYEANDCVSFTLE